MDRGDVPDLRAQPPRRLAGGRFGFAGILQAPLRPEVAPVAQRPDAAGRPLRAVPHDRDVVPVAGAELNERLDDASRRGTETSRRANPLANAHRPLRPDEP